MNTEDTHDYMLGYARGFASGLKRGIKLLEQQIATEEFLSPRVSNKIIE
jgi:hypothetical protein